MADLILTSSFDFSPLTEGFQTAANQAAESTSQMTASFASTTSQVQSSMEQLKANVTEAALAYQSALAQTQGEFGGSPAQLEAAQAALAQLTARQQELRVVEEQLPVATLALVGPLQEVATSSVEASSQLELFGSSFAAVSSQIRSSAEGLETGVVGANEEIQASFAGTISRIEQLQANVAEAASAYRASLAETQGEFGGLPQLQAAQVALQNLTAAEQELKIAQDQLPTSTIAIIGPIQEVADAAQGVIQLQGAASGAVGPNTELATSISSVGANAIGAQNQLVPLLQSLTALAAGGYELVASVNQTGVALTNTASNLNTLTGLQNDLVSSSQRLLSAQAELADVQARIKIDPSNWVELASAEKEVQAASDEADAALNRLQQQLVQAQTRAEEARAALQQVFSSVGTGTAAPGEALAAIEEKASADENLAAAEKELEGAIQARDQALANSASVLSADASSTNQLGSAATQTTSQLDLFGTSFAKINESGNVLDNILSNLNSILPTVSASFDKVAASASTLDPVLAIMAGISAEATTASQQILQFAASTSEAASGLEEMATAQTAEATNLAAMDEGLRAMAVAQALATEGAAELTTITQETSNALEGALGLLQQTGTVSNNVAEAFQVLTSSTATANVSEADFSSAVGIVNKALATLKLQLVETAEGYQIVNSAARAAAGGMASAGSAALEAGTGLSAIGGLMAYLGGRAGGLLLGLGQLSFAFGILGRQAAMASAAMGTVFISIAAVAVPTLLIEGISTLIDKFHKAQDEISKTATELQKLGFEALDLADNLEISNLKLEDSINILAGLAPTNKVAISAREAKVEIDKLIQSFETLIQKELDAQATGEIGFFKGLLAGVVPTSDISADVKEQLDKVQAALFAQQDAERNADDETKQHSIQTTKDKAEDAIRALERIRDKAIQTNKDAKDEIDRVLATPGAEEISPFTISAAADIGPKITDLNSKINALKALQKAEDDLANHEKELKARSDIESAKDKTTLTIEQADANLRAVKTEQDSILNAKKEAAEKAHNLGLISDSEEISRINAAEAAKTEAIIAAEEHKLAVMKSTNDQLVALAAKNAGVSGALLVDTTKLAGQMRELQEQINAQNNDLETERAKEDDKFREEEIRRVDATQKALIAATQAGSLARINAIESAEQTIIAAYGKEGQALPFIQALDDQLARAQEEYKQKQVAAVNKANEEILSKEKQTTKDIIDDAKNRASEQETAIRTGTDNAIRAVKDEEQLNILTHKQALAERLELLSEEQDALNNAINNQIATLQALQDQVKSMMEAAALGGASTEVLDRWSALYQQLGRNIDDVTTKQENLNTKLEGEEFQAQLAAWSNYQKAIQDFTNSATSDLNTFVTTVATTNGSIQQMWSRMVFSIEKQFIEMILKLIERSAAFEAIQRTISGALSKVFSSIGLGPANKPVDLTGIPLGGGVGGIAGIQGAVPTPSSVPFTAGGAPSALPGVVGATGPETTLPALGGIPALPTLAPALGAPTAFTANTVSTDANTQATLANTVAMNAHATTAGVGAAGRVAGLGGGLPAPVPTFPGNPTLPFTARGAPTAVPGVIGAVGGAGSAGEVAQQTATNTQLNALYQQDVLAYRLAQLQKVTATTGAQVQQSTAVATGNATQTASTGAAQTAQTAATNQGVIARVARSAFGVIQHILGEGKKTAATEVSQHTQTATTAGGETTRVAATAKSDAIIVNRDAVAGAAAAFASVIEALPFPENVATAPGVATGVQSSITGIGLAEKGALLDKDMPIFAHANELILPSKISSGLQDMISGEGSEAPSEDPRSLSVSSSNEPITKDNLSSSLRESLPSIARGTSFLSSSIDTAGNDLSSTARGIYSPTVSQETSSGIGSTATDISALASNTLVGEGAPSIASGRAERASSAGIGRDLSSTTSNEAITKESLSSTIRESLSSTTREISALSSAADESLSSTAASIYAPRVNQETSSGIGSTATDVATLPSSTSAGDRTLPTALRGQFEKLSSTLSNSTEGSNLALGILRKSLGAMISNIPAQDRTLTTNIKNQFQQVSGALSTTASSGNSALGVLNKSLGAMVVNTNPADNRQLLAGINSKLTSASSLAPTNELAARLSYTAPEGLNTTTSILNSTNTNRNESTNSNLNFHFTPTIHGDFDVDRHGEELFRFLQGKLRRMGGGRKI